MKFRWINVLGLDQLTYYLPKGAAGNPYDDNALVLAPGSGSKHDRQFTIGVSALERRGFLAPGFAKRLNDTISATEVTPGRWRVAGGRAFDVLAVAVSAALFTRELRAVEGGNLGSTADLQALAYARYNIGGKGYEDFLSSAASRGSLPGSGLSWAFHSPVAAGSPWGQARINAIKFQYFTVAFGSLFGGSP